MIAASSAPATNVTAGLGGFLVLFFLALACWFLYRSMNRHLRKVRYEAGDLTSNQRAAEAAKKDTRPVDSGKRDSGRGDSSKGDTPGEQA